MSKSALLIVDLQEFFLSPEAAAYFPAAERALAAAARLARSFREGGLPVAFSAYATAGGSPMSRRWRKACPEGSRWTRVDRRLSPRPQEPVFVKTSYSALRNPGCLSWLKISGAACLVVAGVQTSLCVESTVRDAFEEGFEVVVSSDACADKDAGMHRASLKAMARGFAEVLPAGRLLERIFALNEA